MNARVPNLDPLLQARYLASMLRSSRLTLCYGAVGAGRTGLLSTALLPLLRRRTADLAASLGQELRSASRRPDRRAHGPEAGAAPAAELAIVVDDWAGSPVSQVRDRLNLALPGSVTAALAGMPRIADALAAASQQVDTRFLFVLDRFDHCLPGAPERPEAVELVEQLVQIVNDRALPVHFLLGVHEDAEPRLAGLKSLVSGFSEHYLHLPKARRPGAAASQEAAATVVVGAIASPAVPEPPAAPDLPAVPASPDAPAIADVPAVQLVASPAPHPVAPEAIEAPLVEAHVVEPLAAMPTALPARPDPVPHQRPPRAVSNRVAGSVALAASAVLAFLIWPDAQPKVDAPMARAPETTALAPAASLAKPVTPPVARAAPDFAAELASLLGAAGGTEANAGKPAGWAEALAFKTGAPRLVAARYDALQAVRANPNAPALRIVAPLAIGELLFVVRADSPLDFIHEIAGRPVDAGPAPGARALTAATVQQRLEGAKLAAAAAGSRPSPVPDAVATQPASYSTEAAALQRLADSGAADDVVFVVDVRALDTWAAAHPDAMRRLKVLRLDKENAASRNALKTYLPRTLRAADHRAWLTQDTPTLAAMSFLVTAESAEQADPAFIETFARTLCDRLPQLQRTGDPKWREVVPQNQLPAGWPYSPTAARAFAACAAPTANLVSQSSQPAEGARP